jgi:competence protein ComEA
MKSAVISIAIAASVLAATTLVVASAVRQDAQAQAASDDPATSAFEAMCSDCHDSERIVSPRRSKADWEDVINKMIEKGATGSAKDFETVFGYLLRHYGKVFVNNATPDELIMVLGLSQKDANAIVSYRKSNGSFADFDAIKKVPDIDVKTLEQHKDAVAF